MRSRRLDLVAPRGGLCFEEVAPRHFGKAVNMRDRLRKPRLPLARLAIFDPGVDVLDPPDFVGSMLRLFRVMVTGAREQDHISRFRQRM